MPPVGRATTTGQTATRRRIMRAEGASVPAQYAPLNLRVSASVNRTTPAVLHGATLSGSVAIFHLRLADDPFSTIVRVQWFVDPPTADPAVLPTATSEATYESFVRADATEVYDLRGGQATATMWDTHTDPTGNGRSNFAADGPHQVVAVATYTDGHRASYSATFTVTNTPPAPTDPAVPSTPTATTPAANTVLIDWSAGTGGPDAASFDYQWRAAGDTAGEWRPRVNVTASEATISDLAAGIVHSFRVRAVAASGATSAWTTPVDATPTGSGTTKPPSTRVTGGTNRRLSHCFRKGPPPGPYGNDSSKYLAIPGAWAEGNVAKVNPNDDALAAAIKGDSWSDPASMVNLWANRTQNFGDHLADIGPMAMINLPLCYTGGYKDSDGKWVSSIPTARPSKDQATGNLITSWSTNNIRSIQVLAASAAGANNGTWSRMALKVLDLNDLNYGGRNDWQRRFYLRVGHENNGPWYPWYSGIDPNIASWFDSLPTNKQAEFVASLGNVSYQDLVRPLIETGNRGPIYAEAYRQCMTSMRGAAPERGSGDFIFDWNVSHPGASPDGEDPNELTRQWNPDAWPGDGVDIITDDVYGRGSGRDATGFTATIVDNLAAIVYLGAKHNRAIGFGEVGVPRQKYVLWVTGTTYGTGDYVKATDSSSTRYRVSQAFTASAGGLSANCMVVDASAGASTEWAPATTYPVGARVTRTGTKYRVTQTFTSGATFSTVCLQVNAGLGSPDVTTASWWKQFFDFLDGKPVLHPTSGATLIPARFIEGRHPDGTLLPAATIAGTNWPAVTQPVKVAYWMYWGQNESAAGAAGKDYRNTVSKATDPLTWAVIAEAFNVGPYA